MGKPDISADAGDKIHRMVAMLSSARDSLRVTPGDYVRLLWQCLLASYQLGHAPAQVEETIDTAVRGSGNGLPN